MNRYWHHSAFRILINLGLGFILIHLALFLGAIELLIILLMDKVAPTPYGVLDFAGGSVVFYNGFAILFWTIPFIVFAEIYAWRHKRPLPFKISVVFLAHWRCVLPREC